MNAQTSNQRMSLVQRAEFCKACGSVKQNKYIAEVGIRSGGLKNIDEQRVFVFPRLRVSLDCGDAEFVVPEAELRELVKGDAAAAG